MKSTRSFHDAIIAASLTAVLHLVVIQTAVLPPGNYFFPFVSETEEIKGAGEEVGKGGMKAGSGGLEVKASPPAGQGESVAEPVVSVPYQPAARQSLPVDGPAFLPGKVRSLTSLATAEASGYRSLTRHTPLPRLAPPEFSTSTIPPRPEKPMGQEMMEDTEAILLGNVFDDAMAANSSSKNFLQAEAEFKEVLRRDIADGRLDMSFATFILSAEFFQLSRSLLVRGRQPSFTLEQAMARYHERLARVGEGLPRELDGYSLVMILQRYAENKYYPGNGSGMLLDALFHQQNDCEGGTKELLAHLQALYPGLDLGSNRGMLQTTTGELIGHMQVFLGPGPASAKILENQEGLVVETTRVGLDSIRTYQSGDVFPLEDFVVRYYPEIAADSPLAALYADKGGAAADGPGKKVVGTSDHPLKMGYGATATVLAGQLFDLASLRTQKIVNEFLRSDIPSCDPRIDPTRIDRGNLFSNFVTINPKLRRSLIGHYLADLQYWDNQVMPQWREPSFLATYDDLAGSLLAAGANPSGYIQIDGENAVPLAGLESHRLFLIGLRDDALRARDKYLGSGLQECTGRTVLDDRLLAFLFMAPEGPGFFFLPAPAENLSWPAVLDQVLADCLAIPASADRRSLLPLLEDDAARQQTSLRKEVYRQARGRGLVSSHTEEGLEATAAALAGLVTGTVDGGGTFADLAGRQSPESTAAQPSVRETLAESGKTGINGGMIWDIGDFLGNGEMRRLFLLYGQRPDLQLSVIRAQELVVQLAAALDESAVVPFLMELQDTPHRNLRLAATMQLAKVNDQSPALISAQALQFLQESEAFRAEDLLPLLHYGLLPEDALTFIRGKSTHLLEKLARQETTPVLATKGQDIFLELVEMVKTLQQFPDNETWQHLHSRLAGSLLQDFRQIPASGDGGRSWADYGLLFNKLAILALLHGETGKVEGTGTLPLAWMQHYIRFAGTIPIGKLMLAPIEKILGGEGVAEVLEKLVPQQLAALEHLPVSGEEALAEAKAILGDANVIARLLTGVDSARVARLAGRAVDRFAGNEKAKAVWYLEQLHRRIVPLVHLAEGKPGPPGTSAASSPAGIKPGLAFYLDDRVRESFALLAYFQGEGGGEVKFRRTQDLATIKDPGAIKVIEGERRITRQDMSLLTLAMNPQNPPPALRRAWEETLGVTGKHLGLPGLDQELRQYLFAPHFPYLTENDSGFFFSPETVEDLHNAAQWGGKNDILLSSYLHFRNLPERLPQWLERTAMARSELELEIIKKFEQLTFLPMILQCDSDKKELPEPLFRAKWSIRKPFGEDIFPGTLLLLRLGYLEITAAGEIIRTAKYFRG